VILVALPLANGASDSEPKENIPGGSVQRILLDEVQESHSVLHACHRAAWFFFLDVANAITRAAGIRRRGI
jgi:hypothetical protein